MIHTSRCACEINHGPHPAVFHESSILSWRHGLSEVSEEEKTWLCVLKNRSCSNINDVKNKSIYIRKKKRIQNFIYK